VRVLEDLTSQLAARNHLTENQVRCAVEELVDELVSPATKANFLSQLGRKGETIGEIAAFASALREKSIRLPIDDKGRLHETLDIVGTGGDQSNTFNISTASALVCAAAGVTVAKHGNRAVTSRCGSADVLAALGVPIDLSPADAVQSLRKHGFAFFFAPNYHPAFRHVAAARKLCAERGQRTIFNSLGPLLNPARPGAMLAGAPRPELCEPLARVLQSLGVRRAMVVCGHATAAESGVDRPESGVRAASRPASSFVDELSALGDNTIAEFHQVRGFAVSLLSPAQFPVQPASLADLLGGDRENCAAIVRYVLGGRERGPKRDAVLLNAGAALFVAGRARSIAEGWELAADVIDSGRAQAKLAALTARP
jgi:anthranilate phosphoribosyltransferase